MALEFDATTTDVTLDLIVSTEYDGEITAINRVTPYDFLNSEKMNILVQVSARYDGSSYF